MSLPGSIIAALIVLEVVFTVLALNPGNFVDSYAKWQIKMMNVDDKHLRLLATFYRVSAIIGFLGVMSILVVSAFG